ncbi:MAG: hypothetical protein IKQ71_04005 [Lachnospiraceae bacterium]|nr:hypothetical protein [Lachnospiraceae bacterium]
MNKIIVNVYLPMAEKSYDIKIPVNVKIGDIVSLVDHCFNDLESGYYISSADAVLCMRETGTVLDIDKTPRQLMLNNGEELMLL